MGHARCAAHPTARPCGLRAGWPSGSRAGGLPAWRRSGPRRPKPLPTAACMRQPNRATWPRSQKLAGAKSDLNVRDGHGRTPLHVATFARQREAIRALAKAGADLNLLEHDRYDAVTIASVADDEETLRTLLALGASARQVTSRYDGTALIAAAHLGPRRRGAAADRSRCAAGSREQPALDGRDRIHRAGQRRAAPPVHAEGIDRCRGQPAARRSPGADPVAAGPGPRISRDGRDAGKGGGEIAGDFALQCVLPGPGKIRRRGSTAASARKSRSLCTSKEPCSSAIAAIRQSVDLRMVNPFARACR